jgi:hypothetical protein
MSGAKELESLIARAQIWDGDNIDFTRQYDEIRFKNAGGIMLTSNTMSIDPGHFYEGEHGICNMTDWALGQVCDKLRTPKLYIERCPKELRATNWNYWRVMQGEKGIFMRVRKTLDVLRAFLSAAYVPINNSWMLRVVADYMGEEPYELGDVRHDKDEVNIKVVVKRTEGGGHGHGFMFANGEIGNRMVHIAPFVLETSCTNSIVFIGDGYSQRHIHITPLLLRAQVRDAIANAMVVAEQRVDDLIASKTTEIPDLASLISELCERRGYSEHIESRILVGTRGKKTLWGLVQGLSFAGGGHVNKELHFELTALAGAALMSRDLTKVNIFDGEL